MNRSSRITLMTVTLTILVLVVALTNKGTSARWLADLSARFITPVTEHLGYGQSWLGVLFGHHDLVGENIELRSELEKARVQQAQLDELAKEVEFLRQANGLSTAISGQPVEAGVFAYLREGGLREVVIDHGQNDGLNTGDVVVTSQGDFLGLIKEVFRDHSTVRTVQDPDLEITARVMGTNVAGLLHSDANGDLILDLVKRAETVSEGQSILTSGNDGLPGGILIGTVRSVDTESSTLFKTVRVSPSVSLDFSGKVLVFRQ